jgi:hypothetical protein
MTLKVLQCDTCDARWLSVPFFDDVHFLRSLMTRLCPSAVSSREFRSPVASRMWPVTAGAAISHVWNLMPVHLSSESSVWRWAILSNVDVTCEVVPVLYLADVLQFLTWDA